MVDRVRVITHSRRCTLKRPSIFRYCTRIDTILGGIQVLSKLHRVLEVENAMVEPEEEESSREPSHHARWAGPITFTLPQPRSIKR